MVERGVDGPSPIPAERWRGQVTDFNVGSENQSEVWRFTLMNDDVNPKVYVKVKMGGGTWLPKRFFHGPQPSVSERFEIIEGKWENSQVEADRIRNLVTGAETWVSLWP